MSDLNQRLEHIIPGSIAMIGIPSDENSTFMRGPALAPAKIREVLHCGSANLYAENGYNLSAADHFKDLGDLKVETGQTGFDQIEADYCKILAKKVFTVSIGGDHAVTFPIIKAHAKHYAPLNIIHFDAHPDLYDDFEGNPLSHASPFARIMENNLANRLVQIGIRTLNDHQREQVKRFGVECFEMNAFNLESIKALRFDGPVYISIDLDALDPAFAPGVSHHEPGGLSTRDIITVIQQLDAQIVGADVVEYNPKRDQHDMTAMVAVKLLKEVSAQILKSNS